MKRISKRRAAFLAADYSRGFIEHCQIKAEIVKRGYFQSRVRIQDHHRQQDGFIHAGLMATMADHTAGYAAFSTVSEEFQILKWWGVKGENFSVDKDGYYYRTPAQTAKWKDKNWRDKIFGQTYFSETVCWDNASLYSDGKNSVGPQNQPSIFQAELTDQQKEVLKAYDAKT